MAQKKELAEEPQTDEKVTIQAAEDAAAVEPAETVEPAEPAAQEDPQQKLENRLKEAEDRNLRLMAEFDNFRRRTQKERESVYPDAVADIVKELLPLLDNFQRAQEAPSSDEEYKKGVQMIYNGFLETLGKLGLVEFGGAGEPFDPAVHNAVMHIEDESKEKNVISQVFQRGYKIGDRVLRYAMVQTAN